MSRSRGRLKGVFIVYFEVTEDLPFNVLSPG
jgi:hypothetical protein